MLKKFYSIMPVLILSACSGFYGADRSAGGAPPHESASKLSSMSLPALVSETPVQRGLVAVNSILVAPIFFSQQSRELRSHAAPLYQELCTAASESLDIAYSCGPEVYKRFDRSSGVPPLSELLDYAKRLGKDGVFILAIEKFVQREGSAYAAANPAEISLSMQLIRSSDSVIVWSASYYLKDQSLIENLFSAESKLARKEALYWKTASEMFVKSAREAFADLSAKRIEQFS